MARPSTSAGRQLLEHEALNSRSFPLITTEAIVAIETEAARAERDAIRDMIDRFPTSKGSPSIAKVLESGRRQVLDLLDARDSAGPR